VTNQVFQVKGVSDSHPEHAEWVVATYSSHSQAQKHKDFLVDFLTQVLELDRQNGNTELQCALRNYHPFDSGYTDCGGVGYSVETVEVREQLFHPGVTPKEGIEALVRVLKAVAA
jgi:hypothetical protein